MANYLAIQLDRSGHAEMSCIVGVGGNVKKLVHTAKSGRKLIAIDGCPLACSRACLHNHNLNPDLHVQLTDLGIRKRQGVDFDPLEANQVLKQLQTQLTEYPLIDEQSKNTFTFQNN
jgi:uncharacterized metal-binding protein